MQPSQPVQGQVDFRIIQNEDAAFLYQLYASTRDWESALSQKDNPNWSKADEEDFLRMQFRLQTEGYATSFPNAIHRIVQLNGQDAGRLIIDMADTHLHVIDISLLPQFRGLGLGSDILRGLMAQAAGGKVPVKLSVDRMSPAQRMYARLGFQRTSETASHVAMEWQPDTGPKVL